MGLYIVYFLFSWLPAGIVVMFTGIVIITVVWAFASLIKKILDLIPFV